MIKVCLTWKTLSIKVHWRFPLTSVPYWLFFFLCFLSGQSDKCMIHSRYYVWLSAADLCIVKKTSHKKSQSPHFRFPPVLFIASAVSHNAHEVVIYLGSLWWVGGIKQTFCQCNLSPSCLVFTSTFTHPHTHTQMKPCTTAEYVTMAISSWQDYVWLWRKTAGRTTHGRTLRPGVIKLSGGAAVVDSCARPDTPEGCYGEKCFSAFLLHPSGSSSLNSSLLACVIISVAFVSAVIFIETHSLKSSAISSMQDGIKPMIH